MRLMTIALLIVLLTANSVSASTVCFMEFDQITTSQLQDTPCHAEELASTGDKEAQDFCDCSDCVQFPIHGYSFPVAQLLSSPIDIGIAQYHGLELLPLSPPPILTFT